MLGSVYFIKFLNKRKEGRMVLIIRTSFRRTSLSAAQDRCLHWRYLLPHFGHHFLWFIRLPWATDGAYQHQAVIQRNSIIPHLLPAVSVEEIAVPVWHQAGRREELWLRRKKEKKTVTSQKPPNDGSHTHFKGQADLFLSAIQDHYQTFLLRSIPPDSFLCVYILLQNCLF